MVTPSSLVRVSNPWQPRTELIYAILVSICNILEITNTVFTITELVQRDRQVAVWESGRVTH